MRKDQNVYIKKDNGRYEAIGVCSNFDYMGDGIWYVRHHDYSRGYTYVPYIAGLFRVGDAAEIDIPTLCGLEDMCDKIFRSKEYREVIDNKNGYTIQELVHACVKVMYDESKKKQDNEGKGTN